MITVEVTLPVDPHKVTYEISHPLNDDEIVSLLNAVYGYEGWTDFKVINSE